MLSPGQRRQRHIDAHVPALLVRIEVRNRRAVLDPAGTLNRPRIEQAGLDERGLAGTPMPRQRHVAQSLDVELLHVASLQRSAVSDQQSAKSWLKADR